MVDLCCFFMIMLFLALGYKQSSIEKRNILYGLAGLWFTYFLYESWIVSKYTKNIYSAPIRDDILLTGPIMMGGTIYGLYMAYR